MQFDRFGIPLSQTPQAENNDYSQRRRVEFARYQNEYKTYDQMDQDLNALNRIADAEETHFEGVFGVFGLRKPLYRKLHRQRPDKKNRTDLGNEWLSNELIDDALLTASALNGDTYFLDLFGNDLDLAPATPSNDYPQDEMMNLLFHKRDPVVTPNHIQLQPFDKSSQMPSHIMEIVEKPPLPSSLAIDKFGLPTTALQVNPMTRYLLTYYIECVADMMTVIPLPKNPWKFIYFPRAISAVGELGSLGRTSNAKNCLLNALLAVSAFNLQSKFTRNSEEMKFYLNLGIQLRQQASIFLKNCLNEDILVQKYKDVLVAVLSMVTIDIVWGTMSDCKRHLDFCEHVIEKKMAVKNKLSFKATILHRIFSNLKLIQDSTSLETVCDDEIFLNESNYRNFIIGAEETAPKPGVFHEKMNQQGKIRIEFIVNNKTDTVKAKDKSLGSNVPAFIDITRSSFQPSSSKLDNSMISSDAIYGLPNSLILLFSEVVHLVRFKVHHDTGELSLPNFFHSLSKEFDNKLASWNLEWKLKENGTFISSRHEGIYHHVMSFYHGLIIYFNRLIRHVNPMFLQEHVEKVLIHLNKIQEIVDLNKDALIIPLFWQGFIAGSEAMTVFLQTGFKSWGHNISKTGIGTYWVARQIMLEVWRRRNHNEKKGTWMDVIREWEMNVMLC